MMNSRSFKNDYAQIVNFYSVEIAEQLMNEPKESQINEIEKVLSLFCAYLDESKLNK